MKIPVLIFLSIFSISNLFAQEKEPPQGPVIQPDSIEHTMVLIGDAGQLTNGRHPVVAAVRQHIPLTKKTTIIYLGDNLYKEGLPDNTLPTYEMAKAPLDSQIVIADSFPSKVYFVPGNHDWSNGRPTGYQSILRVQSYIDILGNNQVAMLPRDGCPGPDEVKITDDVLMIMMDSQWWLQQQDKPGVESDCPTKTKEEVLTQLEDILAKNSKKLILFAFHHPFRSYGPHGGYFTLKQHIFPFTDINDKWFFPLPVIGSAYPLTRAVFGTIQDLKHPLYQNMIKRVEKVVKGHPNVIFMSGHEHTLQLIKDSGYNFIVSGSGSKSNRVSQGKNTEYATSLNGFATLDISSNKNVTANFFTVEGDGFKKAWSGHILDFSKIKEEEKVDSNRVAAYKFRDSVLISASEKYKPKSNIQRWIIGDNYRKEWSEPIVMKEFDINKVKGGLTPKSLGGGKQSKSLKLEDKTGREWTLRTLDKDPEKAVPENLRGTFAQQVVQDMISAAHPYAPLVVAPLAQALNIPADQPEVYFVPDDPQLDYYRPYFANTVNLFEDREPTANDEAKSTNKIINKMYEDNDHHVDQKKVLKARLLDILIADWDRHADQWKWGTDDTGKGKLYYPIPRDRDQAFFDSDGLFIKFATMGPMMYMKGFNKNIGDIKAFNWVARDFDRSFLNHIDEPTWKAQVDSFVTTLTDDVIKDAVKHFPPEIYKISGEKIEQKLISRRDQMSKKSLEYYRFISKEVKVTGSNEQELFHVTNDKGNPKLTVYKKTDVADSLGVMFQRTFDPRVTEEIQLWGLNEADRFVVDPDVNSKITLRIIGGKGNDTFDLKGNMRSRVYDLSTENNHFLADNKAFKRLSSDVAVLDYSRNNYEYDRFQFPQLNLGFNSEDFLLLGVGATKTTYGFRNEPYATKQKLTTLFAPFAPNAKLAYQLRYKGEFNRIIGSQDLVVKAEFVNPTLNNFFGIGNGTAFDKDKGMQFYRVRHKFVEADIMLRKRKFSDVLSISAGPSYFQFWSNYSDNENRILGHPSSLGFDSAHLFANKQYLGGKAELDVNFIDNELFPTRGITWFSSYQMLQGMTNESNNLVKLTSDMTIYGTVSDESRVTAILRAGGGKIFSQNPEYFQMLNLGANNFLRGYRKNRFSGNSMLYGGAELRFRLFRSNSYLLPGDVGLMGYYDAGRVWSSNDTSKKWHSSPGVGIYYAPANLLIVGASVGFSKEATMFNLSVGTKFNINF